MTYDIITIPPPQGQGQRIPQPFLAMGLNNTIWLVMEAYVTGKMIGGKYEVITVKRVDVTPQIRHIMREMIVDLFREDAG